MQASKPRTKDDIQAFIDQAPLAGSLPLDQEKKPGQKKDQKEFYVHLPMNRELRAKLKSDAASKGKGFYKYLIELLENSTGKK